MMTPKAMRDYVVAVKHARRTRADGTAPRCPIHGYSGSWCSFDYCPNSTTQRASAASHEAPIAEPVLERTQIPSVGRIVHYFGKLEQPFSPGDRFSSMGYSAVPEPDSGPFAALVIDVGPSATATTLEITGRTGHKYIRTNIAFDDGMTLGTWSWPARV